MADFPSSIYSPRTMTNRAGVSYDAARTKDIYAEDFNLDRDEIVAIETELGLDPKGSYDDVAARLQYLEDNLGGIAFPVGSVYISVVSTDPATLLGYGTWSRIANGKCLVGLDSEDEDFDTAEETGGEKTHKLTGAESGEKGHNHTQDSHNHIQDQHLHSQDGARTGTNSSGGTGLEAGTGNTGYTVATNQPATATNQAVSAADATDAHNNLQPYFVVYIWKRTA